MDIRKASIEISIEISITFLLKIDYILKNDQFEYFNRFFNRKFNRCKASYINVYKESVNRNFNRNFNNFYSMVSMILEIQIHWLMYLMITQYDQHVLIILSLY